MDFVIVHFLNENSVAIVPKQWLVKGDRCYWPPYRGRRLDQAVQKLDSPDPETWQLLSEAKAMHCYGEYFVNTSGIYSDNRIYLKKLGICLVLLNYHYFN